MGGGTWREETSVIGGGTWREEISVIEFGTWREEISVIWGGTWREVISVKVQVPKSATLMRRAVRSEDVRVARVEDDGWTGERSWTCREEATCKGRG